MKELGILWGFQCFKIGRSNQFQKQLLLKTYLNILWNQVMWFKYTFGTKVTVTVTDQLYTGTI